MREYSLKLNKALSMGLRPDPYAAKNSPYLTSSLGLRPTKYSLTAQVEVVNPFANQIYSSFPNPQLIKAHGGHFLASQTTLYDVIEDPLWGATSIALTGKDDRSAQIVPGGMWHFVDMFKSWMMFNGSCTVFRTNIYGAFNEGEYTIVEKDMKINTGCYHHGRVLLGGFNSANFFSTDWMSIVESLRKSNTVEIASPTAPGSNFIFWSSIGGGDLFNLFYPEFAINGILIDKDVSASINQPLFLDYMRRNECGFMPMSWKGDVLCIKSLRDRVVVYGSAGSAVLHSATNPIPTYGIDATLDVGIPDRGAVGGNDSRHLLMDTTGALWMITERLSVQDTSEGFKRLGYEEYFQDFLGLPISIVYNPLQHEFYISGGSPARGYVLTETGLGELKYPVTSGFISGNRFVGIANDDITLTGSLVTDTIDFDYAELKTVGIVAVQGVGLEGATISAFWYNKVTKAWVQTVEYPLNGDGWARIGITAQDIRISVTVPDYRIARIDDIVIHYNISSNRSIRGLYVNQAQQ